MLMYCSNHGDKEMSRLWELSFNRKKNLTYTVKHQNRKDYFPTFQLESTNQAPKHIHIQMYNLHFLLRFGQRTSI